MATKKTGPGRPRKNVIGGRAASTGPGRPRKNIILTKEEREKNAAKKNAVSKKKTTKKVTKKTAVKKKPTTKKTTSKKKAPIKKITTKKTAKKNTITKAFTNHQINKAKGKSNFAMRLLICSFLLFSFSVYKAFFTDNAITNPNNNTNIDSTIETKPEIAETITIESYEEIMGIETQPEIIEETNITGEINDEVINEIIIIPETIITPHTFTRAFDKDETNEEIKILQKFLYKDMLYTGDFEGINNAQTREAIYTFQLKYKIITPQDPINLRGYFGPGTRAKVNAMMPKQ